MKPKEENHPRADTLDAEAQRALKERPGFSIRTKISLGFILFFFLTLGITIASVCGTDMPSADHLAQPDE